MKQNKPVDEMYLKAIELWGADMQIGMLHEEMAELTKAINKHKRNSYFNKEYLEWEGKVSIAEEIADVKIMLEQLEIIFDCSKQVDGFYTDKRAKLRRRLEVADGKK